MQRIKLGEVCDISSSKRIFEKEYVPKGIPFIRGLEISNGAISKEEYNFDCYISHDRYEELKRTSGVPSRNDILITAVGTIGNLYLVDNDKPFYFKDGNILWFHNYKDCVDPLYLKYYMQSPFFDKQLERAMIGAVQKALTIVMLNNIVIDLPDIRYQNEVARILGAIDSKITVNNKIIETSEKLMREIYDYWFVQFDFSDENGRPYKSSGGEMVYDETLKREIPKGWKVQNLLKNDLCKDIKPGIEKFDDTKTYYATADVIDGEMGVGAQINYNNRESRANMQPKPNSVWFAKMKNSIKHITVMPTSSDLLEKSVFSTGFFGLKCESETLPYIRNFIYSDYFEKVKDLNSNGATMEAISNDGVRNVKLLIPDSATLKKYSDVTSVCLSQNDTLRKENAKLTSLRDWLLPMLMNGQAKIAGDS